MAELQVHVMTDRDDPAAHPDGRFEVHQTFERDGDLVVMLDHASLLHELGVGPPPGAFTRKPQSRLVIVHVEVAPVEDMRGKVEITTSGSGSPEDVLTALEMAVALLKLRQDQAERTLPEGP